MKIIHPEYIIDGNQNKKAVILPISEWEQILDEVEELEDIRAYDAAKTEMSESIPFDQAVDEIRKGKAI